MKTRLRVLTILLSLVMVFTFVPIVAFADSDDFDSDEGDYLSLSICGIDFVEYRDGSYAYAGDGSIPGVSYDKSTNTLTLNNAVLNGNEDDVSVIGYTSNMTLTIKLIGKNVLNGCVSDGYYCNSGIRIDGDAGINITGTGSLETKDCLSIVYQEPYVDGSSFDEDYGDYKNGNQGDININGVTLTSNSEGIISQFSNLTITDANITVKRSSPGSAWCYGVKTGYSGVKGKLTVRNATIELAGGMNLSWVTTELNGEYIYAGEEGAEYRIDPSQADRDSFDRYILYKDYILVTPQDKGLPYEEDVSAQYTLNFDANNGKADYASKKITAGESYGDLPSAVRKGYRFTGWYTQKSGGTPVSSGTVHNNAGDVTVYAHWEANKYNIVFNKNGGKGSMAGMKSLTYNQKYTLKANKFSKKGYVFQGWSTSKKGKVKYKNKQSIKNITAVNNKTVTLYAIWRRAIHTPVNLSAGRWFALTYPTHASAAGKEKGIQKYATDWNLPGNKDKGKKVYAMANGVVEYVDKASGSVRIRYTEKLTLTNGYTFKAGHWRSWYGHMKNISVKKGQKIARGKAVGTIGNKGGVPYHLHLALYGDSKKKVLKNYNDILKSKPISPYWIPGMNAKKWYCDNASGSRSPKKLYDMLFDKKKMPK